MSVDALTVLCPTQNSNLKTYSHSTVAEKLEAVFEHVAPSAHLYTHQF